jgi:membrane-associated phospholipid phosphatase
VTTPSPDVRAALPDGLRRPAMAVVGVAIAVFGVLAARYAGDRRAGRVDWHAENVVDSLGGAHSWVFGRLTTFGSPPFVVIAAVVLAGVCLALGRRRLAVLAIVGPGLTGLATTFLKPTIGRTIEGGFAFPSGHTGGATSIALVVALLLVSLLKPGRRLSMALVGTVTLVAGGTIGASMVVVGSHYPTDTLGGFCAAVAIVLSCALLLERLAAVHARRRTASS